jgi:hypothetical protein
LVKERGGDVEVGRHEDALTTLSRKGKGDTSAKAEPNPDTALVILGSNVRLTFISVFLQKQATGRCPNALFHFDFNPKRSPAYQCFQFGITVFWASGQAVTLWIRIHSGLLKGRGASKHRWLWLERCLWIAHPPRNYCP